MSDTDLGELGIVKRASPCSGKGAANGEGPVRRCGKCQRRAYDVKHLDAFQVRELVMREEGRPCMRFFERADGLLLTADCPRGFKPLGWLWNREKAPPRPARIGSAATYVAGLALFVLISMSLITLFGDNIRRLFGMSSGCMMISGDYAGAPQRRREPPAQTLARFDASPPCPTSGAPLR